MRRVALIVAKRDDLVLFGKRRDNGRWTLPGGHLNEGEEPVAGARRELLEETGLEPEGELQLIDEREGGNDLKLYTYECTVAGTPSGKDDPDNECGIWAFLDVSDGIPKDVAENMSGPKDPDNNVAASVFGLAKMAIADIPAGKNLATIRPNSASYDYSHVLPEEHRGKYQIKLKADDDGDYRAELWSHGAHRGFAEAHTTPDELQPANTRIDNAHRGKGLGAALYEAMYAHAYHNGIRKVVGSTHSTAAHALHQRLSQKHGMAYSAAPEDARAHQPAGDYDEKYGPYSYALKSELTKMAIADIPAGKNLVGRQYDYNHVLTPEHRAAGYTMQVRDNSNESPGEEHFISLLSHKGVPIGGVRGNIEHDTITPHSDLEEAHRGKGLGQAMYEALYSHAFHNGIKHVGGGSHSLEARRVHMALARKHGLDYQTFPGEDEDYEEHGKYGDYDYALKSELLMSKREEDDEIDRLLMHPNPSERSMALKLHGVHDKHLVRGLADEDPGIQRQALRHPNLGHAGLLSLMQMPNREHLQQLALEHPAITRAHVEALYHTHKDRPAAEKARMMHAIGHHGSLDAGLIEKMVADGNGDGVVENLNTPSHVIDQLVEQHFLNPSDAHKKALARRALKHPAARLDHVERAFRESPLDVKMAVAQGPHLPEALAQDALMRGQLPAGDSEALLRSFIVQNPKASKRHLETAAQDRNPIVRHAAREKLGKGFQKFEAGLNGFLGASLKKAIRHEDYRGIRSALDAAGAHVVDHKPDLEAHPPQNNADVAAYKQTVVDSANPVKRTAGSVSTNANISRKVVYQVPATHPTHGGARYMVKPYHERISTRLKGWSKHPHQGWAEMTNQALYHAGGIGHLHQNVHVAEHHMGEGHEAEPALVVKMDPNSIPFRHQSHTINGDNPGAPDDIRHQARQIAMMDFLSNNLDRHTGNLMFTDLKDFHPRRLLAIDHSRSFQYTNNHEYKWKKKREQPRQLEDRFGHYVTSPAPTGALAPLRDWDKLKKNPYQTFEDWAPVFDWWGQNSDKIKGTMNKRLEQIKDPEIRAHIARNFDERAHYLDERANMGIENYGDRWWEDPVPQYRPGEKTDSEIEADNWQREYGDK